MYFCSRCGKTFTVQEGFDNHMAAEKAMAESAKMWADIAAANQSHQQGRY